MLSWQTHDCTSERTPIYLRWLLTTYCNYGCNYCFQSHNREEKYDKRNLLEVMKQERNPKKIIKHMFNNKVHAFDNYPVYDWIEAFKVFNSNKIAITISGGEPFLDRKNFNILLKELSSMDNVEWIRIDTNGTWKANQFNDIKWNKIFLNISYHPTMIKLENYIELLKDKIDNKINVTMVNYVLAPNQIDLFHKIKNKIEELGVFVNVNVYFGPEAQTEEGYNIYERYLPKIDINLKTNSLTTKGEPCTYPSFAYEIDPVGNINVGCFPGLTGDFLKKKIPNRLIGEVACPKDNCGCLDMYAFLKKTDRTRNFNIFKEYVEVCIQHRNIYKP